MTSAEIPPTGRSRPLPPVLGRLLHGTFFLALKIPLQAAIGFVSIATVQGYVGASMNGAYVFAWSFGFLQFLLEFGMSSALQRRVAETWERGDREAVDRAVACGLAFYAAVAIIQVVALLTIAYVILPRLGRFPPEEAALVVKLLWLQALTSPFFGLATVISCVLQAARRYAFFPRLDLAVVALRFVILVAGVRLEVDFFAIVAAQTALQVGLLIGPGLAVMAREFGRLPRFAKVSRADFVPLLQVSLYLFLIQLSVVLADQVDTTVLTLALPVADVGPDLTTYQNVSKPFFQIRQAGWTLAYLVMPAAASLAASRDLASLRRIAYDGPRFLVGLLLPVALLAGIYASPFLGVWVGPEFAGAAPLLRLFLVATLPIVISIHVQMAIGLGEIRVVALAALAGSLVNLPLSYVLTRRLGVAGVIWGTVLTTLVSNLLVPGVHVFRVLAIDPRAFLARTLGPPIAGAAALVATTALLAQAWPIPSGLPRGWALGLPLLAHLALASLAYLAGYLATATGRADLAALARRSGTIAA